jgi:hypothetical protein
VTTGVTGVETSNDVQFDKTVRYTSMQVLSMIADFARAALSVLLGRSSNSLFGTPSQTKQYVLVNGDHALKDQQRLVNSYMKFIINKQNASIPAVVAPFLADMRSNMDMIMEIVRIGEVYPSAELGEKPIPWTPLMCACCLNDLKSIRMLCHWGADPNYQNRHGTTALMLCSQLNNVEAMSELLIAGASTSLLDNEGFSAMAYSSSFPMPHDLQRSAVHVICDGEQGAGSSAYRADEVLKLALKYTPEEVKVKILQNEKIVVNESSSKSKHRMKLLEKQGLSPVATIEDLQNALKRVHLEDNNSSHTVEDKDFELVQKGNNTDGNTLSSIEDMLLLDKAESNHDGTVNTIKLAATNSDPVSDLSDLLIDSTPVVAPVVVIAASRCSICTLKIPCSHFFSQSAYDDYLKKKSSGEMNYSDGSALSYEKNIKKRETQIHLNRVTNNVFNQEGMKVLHEAEIDDRKSNRNDRYLVYLKDNHDDKKVKEKEGVKAITDVIPLNPYATVDSTTTASASLLPDSQLAIKDCTSDTNTKSTALEIVNAVENESVTVASTITSPSTIPPTSAAAVMVTATSASLKHDATTDKQNSTPTTRSDNDDVNNKSSKKSTNDNESSAIFNNFVKNQYEEQNTPAATDLVNNNSKKNNGNNEFTLADKDKKEVISLVLDIENNSNDMSNKEIDSAEIHAFYLFTASLPPPDAAPSRSVLMKTINSPRSRALAAKTCIKKFHENKRVIKFKIEDGVVDGGIGSAEVKVTDVSVSSYDEALNPDYSSKVDLILPQTSSSSSSSSSSMSLVLQDNPDITTENKNVTKNDREEVTAAIHTMLVGSKNSAEESDSLKLFGVNPVAPNRRGVSMFTQRYKDAVMLDTKAGLAVDSQTNQGVTSTALTLTNTNTKTKTSTGTDSKTDKQKAPQNSKFLAIKTDQRLYFSGWIFSGLFSLDVAKKPIETVCVDPDNWRTCLTELNDSFRQHWLPNLLRLECLVDVKTWKVSTKQCSACMIGFVRCRDGTVVSEDDRLIQDVCFACFARKKLYDNVVKSIPRSARKVFKFEWPFHVKDNGVETFGEDERKVMIMKFLRYAITLLNDSIY